MPLTGRLNHAALAIRLFLFKPKRLKSQRSAVLGDIAHRLVGSAVGQGGLNLQRHLDLRSNELRQMLTDFVRDTRRVPAGAKGVKLYGAVEPAIHRFPCLRRLATAFGSAAVDRPNGRDGCRRFPFSWLPASGADWCTCCGRRISTQLSLGDVRLHKHGLVISNHPQWHSDL